MKWIIDADPGIDDFAAITAMVRGGAEVIGITAVHGNAPLHHTARNALIITELLGADIPVYAGADQAFIEQRRNAPEVHGANGLGDASLPDPVRNLATGHAADFIIAAAHRYPGELSLLAVGPLTNVALAIAKDRSIVGKIHSIVCMGGTSDARGNATVTAEFNIHADPEAAAVVFESGIPITLVPWETTLKAILTAEEVGRLEQSDKPLARTFLEVSQTLVHLVEGRLGIRGLLLCDLVAAAVALEPAVMTGHAPGHVIVETGGRISRGLTAVDYTGMTGKEPKVTVCTNVDRDRVADLFVRSFTA